MKIKEKDFVEIDFTGKIKDGAVFDSTMKDELEKLHNGHSHEIEARPLIFCLGQGMFLESIDSFLVGKETEKTYDIELAPEKAFGQRDAKLVQMIPMDVFRKQKINPAPGFSLNFDGRVGKILTVSGGRVMVDFNHSLAGKTVEYKITVLRVVTDTNEKIKAVNEFFFRQNFPFEVQDNKIIVQINEENKQFKTIIPLFSDKFKEILGMDLEVKEVAEPEGHVEKKEEGIKKEQ